MVRKQTGPPMEELVERAKRLVTGPIKSGDLQVAVKDEFGIGKNRAKEVVSRLTESTEFARWKTPTLYNSGLMVIPQCKASFGVGFKVNS
jgi:hypothetical protein